MSYKATKPDLVCIFFESAIKPQADKQLTLLDGQQNKDIRPIKLSVGGNGNLTGALHLIKSSVVATASSIISCKKIVNVDILVPAYSGGSRNWPLT